MFKRKPQSKGRTRRKYDRKPFALKVSLPKESKYGDGEYVSFSVAKDDDGTYESIFTAYLSVNDYGAFKGVDEDVLIELYETLGSILDKKSPKKTKQLPPPRNKHLEENNDEDDDEIPF